MLFRNKLSFPVGDAVAAAARWIPSACGGLLLGLCCTVALATPPPSSENARSGPAVDLIHRDIKVTEVAPGIFVAEGVGNVILIATAEGHVVFDTGLALQAAKQREALLAAVPDRPVTHVILSHSHADHTGGTHLWAQSNGKGGAEIIAHQEFTEEQRYLKELEPYLHHRNRTLFPWMPPEPVTKGPFRYGGIQPHRTVDDGERYEFEQGGVRFAVLGAPGAEGADNILLWLPDSRILLSGDFFGPQFPQFPNIFTMRGEKVRAPVAYLESLERVIELAPKMIIPAHFAAPEGERAIMDGLKAMRDGVRHVHDETVAGMNAGKTVHQLMEEIRLPRGSRLSQTHGRVSWAVKSIWEYYTTWFHFDRTTELYPVPDTAAWPRLVEAASAAPFIETAQSYLDESRPLHALHILDIALTAQPDHRRALELKLAALQQLLREAENGLRNDYEIYWLRSRITTTQESLSKP